MNEEMQTTGYTGEDAATGPTEGYDPVSGLGSLNVGNIIDFISSMN